MTRTEDRVAALLEKLEHVRGATVEDYVQVKFDRLQHWALTFIPYSSITHSVYLDLWDGKLNACRHYRWCKYGGRGRNISLAHLERLVAAAVMRQERIDKRAVEEVAGR